jgi:hypothetical protein
MATVRLNVGEKLLLLAVDRRRGQLLSPLRLACCTVGAELARLTAAGAVHHDPAGLRPIAGPARNPARNPVRDPAGIAATLAALPAPVRPAEMVLYCHLRAATDLGRQLAERSVLDLDEVRRCRRTRTRIAIADESALHEALADAWRVSWSAPTRVEEEDVVFGGLIHLAGLDTAVPGGLDRDARARLKEYSTRHWSCLAVRQALTELTSM